MDVFAAVVVEPDGATHIVPVWADNRAQAGELACDQVAKAINNGNILGDDVLVLVFAATEIQELHECAQDMVRLIGPADRVPANPRRAAVAAESGEIEPSTPARDGLGVLVDDITDDDGSKEKNELNVPTTEGQVTEDRDGNGNGNGNGNGQDQGRSTSADQSTIIDVKNSGMAPVDQKSVDLPVGPAKNKRPMRAKKLVGDLGPASVDKNKDTQYSPGIERDSPDSKRSVQADVLIPAQVIVGAAALRTAKAEATGEMGNMIPETDLLDDMGFLELLLDPEPGSGADQDEGEGIKNDQTLSEGDQGEDRREEDGTQQQNGAPIATPTTGPDTVKVDESEVQEIPDWCDPAVLLEWRDDEEMDR